MAARPGKVEPEALARLDGQNDGRAGSREHAARWRHTSYWATYLVGWDAGANPLDESGAPDPVAFRRPG